MTDFKKFRRKQIAELRPYVEGELLSERVSVSEPDKEAGSPKVGDMIARNPKNNDDQWLVAKQYFEDNFEPAETVTQEKVEIKDISKRYFPDDDSNADICYLAIVEAAGKQNLIPLYLNIEIPPDNKATEVFNKALDMINKDAEGAFKIEIQEWMGWNPSCHSLRMKVCPIVVRRFFELGKLFWSMYNNNEK